VLARLRFGRRFYRLGKLHTQPVAEKAHIFLDWPADVLNSAYCGMPAGMEAFRVADRVLNEMEEKGEFIRDRD
jgi:hypothetical protein